MDATLKKGVGLLLLVFVGLLPVHGPQRGHRRGQGPVRAVWDGLKHLFAAMIHFLNALFA